MDLRDYPIGEEKIPAQKATCAQLREEAERSDDPQLKERLVQAANWREFFEDLHNRIIDTLADKIDSIDRGVIQDLLEWEIQLSVEHILKNGKTISIS
jgi:hypothetical protein